MSRASEKKTVHKSDSLPRRTETRRSISLPLLVGTVVALLVLVPGLYFWRLKQVDRGANVYLERAESLAKEEQWGQSADYLYLYLRLRPDDVTARSRLAETVDRGAIQRPQVMRAIELYYQALASASPKEGRKLRLRLADLLLQTGQFASALEQADQILKIQSEDASGWRVRALALYGAATSGTQGAGDDVGEALEAAQQRSPGDVALTVSLADVLRNRPELQSAKARERSADERARLADVCFDQLVAAAPREASAYLARYQDRSQRPVVETLDERESDLRTALELAPDNPVVLLAAAMHERQDADRHPVERTKHLRAAEKFYAHALLAAPTLDRAYVGLGEVQHLSGRADVAIKTWQQGLEKCGPETVAFNALLAEEFINQGLFEQADECIKRLQATAESLRRRGALESQLTFARATQLLAARWNLLQDRLDEGRAILRELSKGPKGQNPEGTVTFQALMMLGGSYSSQDRETAVAIYADAAAAQPSAVDPYLATAALWLSSGSPDRAVAALEEAIARADTLENRALLLGAMLQEQLVVAPADRNWEPLEAVLRQTKGAAEQAESRAAAWRVAVLEAEYRYRRSGKEAAREVLLAAEKHVPTSPEGWLGLAEAYSRYQFPQDEDRALDRLQKLFPDSATAVLAIARTQATRGRIDDARKVIAEGLARVPEDQRLLLRRALVGVLFEAGQTEEAWNLISEMNAEQPENRDILVQRMELALVTKHDRDAEQLELVYSKLPGIDAVDVLTYRARRLLIASSTDRNDLDEAAQTIGKIREQRPESAAAYVLEAQLFEKKGLLESAADAYQQAIQRGDRQLTNIERLIEILNQLGRFTEAGEYLTSLKEAVPNGAGFWNLEIAAALGSGQTETALKLARQRVASRPQDPLAFIWLGQVLQAQNENAEAEQVLSKAIQLAPQDPRAQGAFLSVLMRSGQTERARQQLSLFVEGLGVPPVQKSLILAAGLQSMGAAEESLSELRKAEQLEPGNAKVQERLGMALLEQNPKQAEAALQRAIELDPTLDTARRALAAILADRGGSENSQLAMNLLKNNHTSDVNEVGNRRMQAMVLARRGGTERLAEARQLLDRNPKSRVDRFLLAQLTEIEGKSDLAGEQYLALSSEESPLPAHVAAYVDWLLRQNMLEETEPWLARLESLDAIGVDALGLRVRWLVASGREREIEPAIEGYVERRLIAKKPNATPDLAQKLEVSRLAGDLYLSAGQLAAAERWYRRAVALDRTEYGRLASAVARQGRIAEAIEMCSQASAWDGTPLPMTILADVLAASDLTAEDVAPAEKLFESALAQYKDRPELLTAIANLRIVQNRFDDAAELYRQILALKPDSVEALNNLAAILADRPEQASEAVELLDRAIEIAGPQPNLLDTKGTLLLSLNRTQEALPLLLQAAASPNPDPRHLFHLAVGHYRSGEMAGARKALADARQRKLEGTVLTKTDGRMLAELDENLR